MVQRQTINPPDGQTAPDNLPSSSIVGQKTLSQLCYGFPIRRIRRVDLDLSVARANVPMDVGGTVILCAWAAQPSTDYADISLGIDSDDLGDPLPVSSGFYLSGVPFRKIFITNDVQAGGLLKLIVLQDEPDVRAAAE